MSRAGLNPSAAMTRGMTETQATMVNSRWFRHSAAGSPTPGRGGPGPRGHRAVVPGDLRRPQPPAPLAFRRAAVVRAAALAGSETGQRFPSSRQLNNSGLPCEPRTVHQLRPPHQLGPPHPDGSPWTRRAWPAPGGPGGLWQAVEVADRTGSTNADLLARALAGAPEGVVLAAEEQSAGRGRMGRTWVSPPRAALTFSLLVRPAAVPPARRGWLPLLAGVAVASAVTAVTGVQTRLKWPNDLLAGPAKLGGILAEAAGDAIVVGVGLNVSAEPGELPPPGPGALAVTSLRIERSAASENARSAALERGPLLIAILADFERRYRAWCRAAGDPGALRAAGRVHKAVRHDRPPRPGRTPRRSGALRAGRRRRPGRQAARRRAVRHCGPGGGG